MPKQVLILPGHQRDRQFQFDLPCATSQFDLIDLKLTFVD